MITLYAVRHARTVAAPGVFVGRRDVPLAIEPALAADAVLTVLPVPPHTVWSSPLARCAETARLVAGSLSVPHRVDARLLEIDHGAWEGRTADDLAASEPAGWARWCEHWVDEGPPGGESATAVSTRVSAWFLSLSPGVHALVGHAGVLRALRVVADGLTWASAMSEPAPHAGELRALRTFRR